MLYHTLPHTNLEVSKICLGTMTFGQQNSEAEAHQQLDLALDMGVNFIDTAEMYAVPPTKETQGLTEKYIGSWLSKSGKRDKVVLATKVAGPRNIPYIRDNMALDRRNIRQAVDDSLSRLQTDYIDLYQVHWPQRHVNSFGKLNYHHQDENSGVTLLDTLDALAELVREGKIRHIGVSNETPWGVMSYLRLAEKHSLPRIVTIQNPYNLLNRSFEVGLSEISHQEGVELLAYSPLAFGACLASTSMAPSLKERVVHAGSVSFAILLNKARLQRSLMSIWRKSLGWIRRKWHWLMLTAAPLSPVTS